MKNKYILLLISVFAFSSTVLAQPGFDPTVDDTAPIPGIILVAVIALGIGARKALKNKS